MNFKKKISKSIALTLVGVATLVPSFNTAYAMEESNTEQSPQLRSIGFTTQRILQSTVRQNGVSTGYATSTWTKASSYLSGRTYSTSGSYSIWGMNTIIGFSKLINANIPADPSRYSRLKGKADITFKKYKVLHYQGGSLYKTTYEVEKVYNNTYLDVVYQ